MVEMNKPTDIRSIGCSLWLLPPSDSPVQVILSDLINAETPFCFPDLHKVVFEPHMTLTSDIMLSPDIAGNKQAQTWLNDLPLPEKVDLDVRLESLDLGAQYFKKVTLRVNRGRLERFGAQVRSAAVENGDMSAAMIWVKETWAPHVSLMYANIEVTAEKREEILQVVTEAGIRIGKEHGLLKDGKGDYSGWTGGRIALIETWKEPKDWKFVASRAI